MPYLLVMDSKTLNIKQYFKLNRYTSWYCFKVCGFLFTGIATVIAVGVKWSKGDQQDPIEVFIYTELFGYGLACFIFSLAFMEGYSKAQMTITKYNRIPDRIKTDYGLQLVKSQLNPKYWFMQFEIVQISNDNMIILDDQMLSDLTWE